MKNLSLSLAIVLGIALSVQPLQAGDILATDSESSDSSVAGELAPEGQVEEDLPLRRFKLKPRPPVNIQEKSRPRIKIPQKPRKKISPIKKFRLKPKGGRDEKEQPKFIPDQVIVKLRPGMSLPSSMMKKFGLQKLRTTSGGHILFRFAIPPGLEKLRNPLTVAQELTKHAVVIFAEPLTIRTPDIVPDDTFFKNHQWNYFENGTGGKQSPGGIGLPKAWDTTTGSRNVVVAVIDTGIVVKGKNGKVHSDIELKNLLPGFDFITDPVSANDNDGRDADPTDPGDALDLKDIGDCRFLVQPGKDTWHGTNVAGIIGLGKTNNTEGVAGVNWEVSILPVRLSGKCGVHPVDEYDAIRWAAGFEVPGAPVNRFPARIINYSMGSSGTCSRVLQEAIDDVVLKKGVSFVASAGNDRTLVDFHTPSNCKNVIRVAASDKRGHLAQYSNFGPNVAIMAPGGKRRPDQIKVPAGKQKPAVDKKAIFDQVLTHNHPDQRDPDIEAVPKGFSFGAGTSLAAPHVSGVLALWLAEDFSLTHEELLKGLQDNAIKRDKAQCPRSCGAGLLNADLSSLIIPGKAVPPPPLKKGLPPKQPPPPPVPQCKVKTSDIVHSLKIDIGNNDSQTTSAKQSLLRMLIHGDVEARLDASGMVKATESGALAGIFQRNKGPVAARGQQMTPPTGWWEFLSQEQPGQEQPGKGQLGEGQLGMCLKKPVGKSPMIIYREQEMVPSKLDGMLRQAWHQCGLQALPFPCVYEKDMGNKPQKTNACLGKAEEAFLKGEKNCDDLFGSKKACENAYQKCLRETGNRVPACKEHVPCIDHSDIQKHNTCMKPFEKKRNEAKALCE